MSGCLGITTNYGALPETCAEWAWMFPVDESADVICARTHLNMQRALNHYWDDEVQAILQLQTLYYQRFWSFESRVIQWEALLNYVIAEGPRRQMLVIE